MEVSEWKIVDRGIRRIADRGGKRWKKERDNEEKGESDRLRVNGRARRTQRGGRIDEIKKGRLRISDRRK